MKDELEEIAIELANFRFQEEQYTAGIDWEDVYKQAKKELQNYCEQKCREARISMANEIYSEYATQFGDTTVFDPTLQAWLRSFVVAENISGKRLSALQTTSEADNG